MKRPEKAEAVEAARLIRPHEHALQTGHVFFQKTEHVADHGEDV